MIYIGADHRGYNLKEALKEYMDEMGIEYQDMGAFEVDPNDDFPRYAKLVAEHVHDADDRGVVICGSGVGVDEVANKVPGIRAGLAINHEQIRAARHDDDINVLALASEFTTEEDAKSILKTFLGTDFGSEDKYKRRIAQIEAIDDEF